MRRSPRVAWWSYVQGLSEYRAGRPESALARLDEALATAPGWSSAAMLLPVRAMAHHALGHTDDARKAFDDARRAVGAFASDVPWWDRVEFRLLLREAERRLDAVAD